MLPKRRHKNRCSITIRPCRLFGVAIASTNECWERVGESQRLGHYTIVLVLGRLAYGAAGLNWVPPVIPLSLPLASTSAPCRATSAASGHEAPRNIRRALKPFSPERPAASAGPGR